MNDDMANSVYGAGLLLGTLMRLGPNLVTVEVIRTDAAGHQLVAGQVPRHGGGSAERGYVITVDIPVAEAEEADR